MAFIDIFVNVLDSFYRGTYFNIDVTIVPDIQLLAKVQFEFKDKKQKLTWQTDKDYKEPHVCYHI